MVSNSPLPAATAAAPGLVVHAFPAAWGLPSSGPFALKLLKWLDVAGLPYALAYAANPSRGPKGKNPWIEIGGDRLGDTELIIARLAARSGFDIDAALGPGDRAVGHALRRMLEEHFHQVLEWELFVHPEGFAGLRRLAPAGVPAPAVAAVLALMRRRFARQLHARGIGRHDAADIAAKGRADIEAVETVLGGKPFLFGDRPSMADVSAWGLLAPMARWPMPTPVADFLKGRAVLVDYLARMEAL